LGHHDLIPIFALLLTWVSGIKLYIGTKIQNLTSSKSKKEFSLKNRDQYL